MEIRELERDHREPFEMRRKLGAIAVVRPQHADGALRRKVLGVGEETRRRHDDGDVVGHCRIVQNGCE